MIVALVLAALVASALIGTTGIGGLLLPPALIYLGGIPAHTATATTSWAFLLTGLAGIGACVRKGGSAACRLSGAGRRARPTGGD